MSNSTDDTTGSPGPKPSPWAIWQQFMRQQRWIPFVLPFAVFILSGYLQPSVPGKPAVEATSPLAASEMPVSEPAAGTEFWLRFGYPLGYTLRIGLTGIAVLLVCPVWLRISWRCTKWAIVIGLVGGLLWIGICRLRLADQLLTLVGLGDWTSFGDRPAFDPYGTLGDWPIVMVAFLAVRLAGLAVIVPLVEEFFLRGFLMRFIERAEWWTLELGTVGTKGAMTATVYGVLAHPAEPVAAAVWFSLITWLYARTRSIWDCVVAHAVTNAMLGAYILTFRDWTLW